MKPALGIFLFFAGAALACGQQPSTTSPAQRQGGVNRRGDQVMGFSHQKTDHHFLLFADGGEINVAANDPGDSASRDMIRMHLQQITGEFAAGDFTDPMLIHATVPPGAPVMKRLRARIDYRYAETPRGAQVRIVTRDREALDAVHEFLRFQIADHHTGDSTQVRSGKAGPKHP